MGQLALVLYLNVLEVLGLALHCKGVRRSIVDIDPRRTLCTKEMQGASRGFCEAFMKFIHS